LNANQLDRRDFSRWSLAALGGTLAGAALTNNTAIAQQATPVEPPPITPPQSVTPPSRPGPPTPSSTPSERPTEPPKDADAKTDDAKSDAKKSDKKPAPPKEIHICRGLNTCAGKGLSGDNKCAGQGTCATAQGAPHQCATGNLCKNQGGCGPTAGKNQCNGYGDGAVPIIEEEWYRLRKEFEARMGRLKKKVGPAPPSPDELEWEANYQAAKLKAEQEIAAKEAAARNQGKSATGGQTNPGRNEPKKDGDSADVLDELTGDREKKKQ
jgi:hypothetical protein